MLWSLVLLSAVAASDAPRFVSPLVKIRPGALPAGDAAARLTAARGECEATQLLVPPPAEDVEVRFGPLKGKTGEVPLRVYQVEYLELEKPSSVEGSTGTWPDPLVPLKDAYEGEPRHASTRSSTADHPYVLYVETCVPKEQKPGTYTGALVVTVDKKQLRPAKLELTVENFELPATSSLPNSFGLSLYSVARGHKISPESKEARDLLRTYATSLLAHRVTAHGLTMTPPRVQQRSGAMEVDFAGYDAELAPFLEGKVLPSGARFTTAELRDVKSLSATERESYSRAVEQHFQKRGWNAQLFFYAKDEPKPDEIPLVLSQARAFAKTPRVPVLVTSPFDARLRGSAGVLCPNLNCFYSRPGPQTCRNVQTVEQLRRELPSARIWWYQSCSSHGCQEGNGDAAVGKAYSAWASYMIDATGPQNRAMGPLAFSSGVDGELYFDTVFAYNTRDPWKSVYEFTGNGDGTLFYPGTPDRIGGKTHVPVESLRLKTLRDGLEDYEYLRLAAACGDKSLARRSALQLASSGYQINPKPEVWQAVRTQLSRRISELWAKGECGGSSNVLTRQ